MPELIAYKSLFVVLVLLGLFVLERRFPAVTVPVVAQSSGRIARNLGLWLCNSLVSPLIVLPMTFFAINAHWGADWEIGWLNGWGRIFIDILLLDAWIYWWHRANHRLPLLWRFHRVHHLDQWLDVTTAVRFHVGEVILSALVRAVVVLSLGIPWLSIVIFESLVLVSAGFHHSNVRLPAYVEQLLSRVVITPSIHWVHHHAIQKDTDSNYGTLFSFWDRLFNSRSASSRKIDMKIGLDQRDDETFGQLILEPFKPDKNDIGKGQPEE